MAVGDISPDEKALTKEDILEQPREFFPTFMEWVADRNAEQISKTKNSAGTIYQVPANKTFFMTGCFITAMETGAVNSHGSVWIQEGTAGSGKVFLNARIDHINAASGGAQAISRDFTMPIRVEAGVAIEMAVSGMTTPFATAHIDGFLLDTTISVAQIR